MPKLLRSPLPMIYSRNYINCYTLWADFYVLYLRLLLAGCKNTIVDIRKRKNISIFMIGNTECEYFDNNFIFITQLFNGMKLDIAFT